MRLLALIERSDHVCYRYRLQAFEPALAARGWTVTALPIAREQHDWRRQLIEAGQADVVVLQRKLLNRWRAWRLRRAARKLVFDLDDAVFFRDSNSQRAPQSAWRLRRFKSLVRLSDAVLAGNRFLQANAQVFANFEQVFHAPTCVDPAKYPPAQHHRRDGQARLVWIGSRSTLPSLTVAAPCLNAAGARLPGLELRMVCDTFTELSGLRVEPRVWSAATETSELSDADIGVSWLPDHPWSLGKCGLKVLQYMAAGLPVVANPVGVHRELIVDGQTGLLAQTPAEWASAIERLARDPALRNTLGAAARKLVERRYSVAAQTPQLTSLLESLAPEPMRRTGKAA